MKTLPVLCTLPLLAAATIATANPAPLQKPKWEIGLFNFVASIPDYRGSDESTVWAFPLPYFVYRGDYFRATREGVRGIVYRGPYFETSLSASGNPPVNRDNRARAGMPKLDAIGELGPSVKWFFLGRDPLDRLYLELSVRAATSLGFDSGPQMRYQGISGSLSAVFYSQTHVKDVGLRYQTTAGIDFGDAGYHRYFYQVDPAYANAERPAYRAHAGYGGLFVAASMQYDVTDTIAIGCYTRWTNVSGAAFAGSPLVRQDNNVTIGAALIFKPWHSQTLVDAEDFD